MKLPASGELWWFDVIGDGTVCAVFLMVRPVQKELMRSHGQDCQLWSTQHVKTVTHSEAYSVYDVWKPGVVSRQLWTEASWYPLETSDD